MAQAQANQNQNVSHSLTVHTSRRGILTSVHLQVLTDGVSRTRLKWDRHKHCTVIAVPWVDEFYFDAVFNRADTAQGRNLLPGQDATKTREAARDSLKTYYVALHKLAQDICEENTNLTKAQKESIKATRHM